MPRFVIMSGGQSGVDRAALHVGQELAIPYAGWCPKGGWAEDIPESPGLLARYPLLRETPLADPAQRTEWNTRDCDAVLILIGRGGLGASPGTALARQLAERHGRPLLIAGLDEVGAAARISAWLDTLLAGRAAGAPLKLRIGGPRESEAPGISAAAQAVLHEVLRGS